MISKDELVNNARAKHLRMVMDENKKFRLQLQAVRELHKKHKFVSFGDTYTQCQCCEKDYPCATIKALDGE